MTIVAGSALTSSLLTVLVPIAAFLVIATPWALRLRRKLQRRRR